MAQDAAGRNDELIDAGPDPEAGWPGGSSGSSSSRRSGSLISTKFNYPEFLGDSAG